MRHDSSTSPADAAHDLAEAVVVDRAVIDLGPLVLAQADEHHLHQAAFDVADEIGVRLDAAADHARGRPRTHGDRNGPESLRLVWQTTTVSMLARIGQPQNASVMP